MADEAKVEANKNKASNAPTADVPASDPPTANTKAEAPQDNSSSSDSVRLLLGELGIPTVEELKAALSGTKSKKEETTSPDVEESEAIQYGVKNGKLKMDDYKASIKASESADRDLVFADFAEKQRAKNKDITDEVIAERFNKKYHQFEADEFDDESLELKKLGEEEISEKASQIRKKYIDPIEETKKSYREYKSGQETIKKVNADFEQIKKDMPKSLKFQFGDESFEYSIDDSVRKEVEDSLYKSYVFYQDAKMRLGLSDNEKFDVNEAVTGIVKDKMFSNIVSAYSKQYADAKVLKELEPYKNPLKRPLDTTEQRVTKAPSEAEQEATIDRAKKARGR